MIQLRTTGRSTHIIVSCPDDSCDGDLFFWPEARTVEGNVVADCCSCTRRFSLSHGRLSELARSPGWREELA